ncbi:MAG: hypothetical protein ACP5D2_04935, partial [Candidatus Nanoarchaeia archaeon]
YNLIEKDNNNKKSCYYINKKMVRIFNKAEIVNSSNVNERFTLDNILMIKCNGEWAFFQFDEL